MEYPGGKNAPGVFQAIINQIPPHSVYLEPFLGSGAIWRHKSAAAVQVGLDLDSEAVYSFSRATGAQVVQVSDLLSGRSGVAVGCAFDLLANWSWSGNEFVYLDPPYPAKVRRGGSIYRFELLSETEHLRLLRLVRSLPAGVAISSYPNSLYERELPGWRRVEFQSMTQAGPATEALYCNYPPPTELHDFRYLGKDRSSRQAFRRKKQRWLARLKKMNPLERQAMLEAMSDLA